jgi:hypothetical protein
MIDPIDQSFYLSNETINSRGQSFHNADESFDPGNQTFDN